MQDAVEVLFPTGDHVFFAPCVEGSRDGVSVTPLDDPPLHLAHSPAIIGCVNRDEVLIVRALVYNNSHCQLIDGPEYGFTEYVQLPPVQAPFESLTHVGAGKPKIDVILFVGHSVLRECKLESDCLGTGERTLIKVKRMVAEPKAI